MNVPSVHVRNARPDEFGAVGELLFEAYTSLEGFVTLSSHPRYFDLLKNIGSLTEKPGTEILIAADQQNNIAGAVVYFNDMKNYGSGGTATLEKNAAGFRFLGVSNKARGRGIGRLLTQACIDKAKQQGHKHLVIHTTMAMKNAWEMYERMGFRRATDLDFQQQDLQVFGFRFVL